MKKYSEQELNLARKRAKDYLNSLHITLSQMGIDLLTEKRDRYIEDKELEHKIDLKQESIETLFDKTKELEKIIALQTIIDSILALIIAGGIVFVCFVLKIK